MRCYECAVKGEIEEAVGICVVCGRSVCLQHSKLQHIPQFRRTDGGMGQPVVRCAHDRPRLVCHECDVATGRGDADWQRG